MVAPVVIFPCNLLPSRMSGCQKIGMDVCCFFRLAGRDETRATAEATDDQAKIRVSGLTRGAQ